MIGRWLGTRQDPCANRQRTHHSGHRRPCAALLGWIQVLPEFAVEALISWHRDVPLMTANFTGALRLLTGLGWPMIWVVHAYTHRRRGGREPWPAVRLEEEHAVEVVGLVPPLL